MPMGIRFHRPTEQELRAIAEASRDELLTYEPVGVTANQSAPPGYRLDRWSIRLGNGEAAFNKSVTALQDWTMHRHSGLVVAAEGGPSIGQIVAIAAPVGPMWVEAVCRVVDATVSATSAGFTYGTLPMHPEEGEESFTVRINESGAVHFEIVAVSRPRHALARVAPPIARHLQRRATNRYLLAMKSAAEAKAEGGNANRSDQ